MGGSKGALPVPGRSRRGKQRHGLGIQACGLSEVVYARWICFFSVLILARHVCLYRHALGETDQTTCQIM